MGLKIRKYLLSYLLLMFTLASGAADTLKIQFTYKHKLDNTGHSTGRMAINQKIYTPDGLLFREISYDENTGQMNGYVFYFYRDGRLFTEEYHDPSDNLRYILKHEYDKAGNELQVTRFQPGDKGLVLTEKTVNKYNDSGAVVQQKQYYGRQAGANTVYFYTESGHLSKKTSKFKPVAKSSSKEETRLYSYSPENVLTQVMITGMDAKDKPFQYREEYSYNDKGLVSAVKTIGITNAASGSKVYKYLPGSSVEIYEEYDAEGKITLLLEYDYKKHYMETGSQVSRYESF
jgi:hypothetical protein